MARRGGGPAQTAGVPLDALLDILLPPACAACGLPGRPVCDRCRAALTRLPPPWCGGCGAPLPLPADRCSACRGRLADGRQAVAYAGPAPAIVGALKDGRRRVLATVLAQVMAETITPPPLGAVLVPVPLGARRLRQRGFNQSLLMARALGDLWGRPVAEAIARTREGPDQRGAGATARARQAAGAFAAGGPDPVPACAWIVDDVLTTGATLADCARALRSGGARRVGAICFARVVGEGECPSRHADVNPSR